MAVVLIYIYIYIKLPILLGSDVGAKKICVREVAPKTARTHCKLEKRLRRIGLKLSHKMSLDFVTVTTQKKTITSIVIVRSC